MKWIITGCMLVFSVKMFAQQDVELPGVVVEQNSKLKTGRIVFLQGVSVKSSQSAPQLTDANGKFKLVFADMPAGNVTRLDVNKDGYEVVNSKVLQSASVAGRKAPFEIVMCKSGLLFENQLAYYTIATDAFTQEYKKKISTLEQGGKNKDELIAKLQKEMRKVIRSKEEAVNAVKEQYRLQNAQSQMIAERLATVNLDDESETYQKAFQAFKAKDIGKAIQLFNSINLEQRLAANAREMKKEIAAGPNFIQSAEFRKKQIKDDVSQCMFKARLHILRAEYAVAKDVYLLGLKYDSLNTTHLWEVGSFFLTQNEDTTAKEYFDKILALSQSDYDRAIVLCDIGKLFKEAGLYDEAEKDYSSGIKLLQQLYDKKPAEYRKILAAQLADFGGLYEELEYYSTALKYYVQADEVMSTFYGRIDASIPDDERLVWANIIHREASLAYKSKNFYSAFRSYYFQVIPLLNGIKEKNSSPGDIYLERASFNYGLSSYYMKDYTAAGEYISSELKDVEQLAKQNPEFYSAELADMLNKTGQIFYEQKAFKKAEELYIKALKISTELSEKNSSDASLSLMSASLNNLGLVNTAFEKYQKAEEFYLKALATQRQLVENKPKMYSAGLAAVLNNMGSLYYRSKSNTKAGQFYKDAIEIYSTLSDRNPDIYSIDYGKSLHNLGRVYDETKDYSNAEKYYNDALKLQVNVVAVEKKLADKTNLATYLTDLSATLDDLKNLYSKAPALKQGQAFTDGLKEYNELKEKYTPAVFEAAQNVKKIGTFFTALQAYPEAEAAYNKAIEQFKEGEKNLPDASKDFKGSRIETTLDLLDVYQAQLETTQDLSYKEKALRLLEELKKLPGADNQFKDRINSFNTVFTSTSKNDLQVMAFLKPIEEFRKMNGERKDNALKIATEQDIIKQLEIKLKEVPGNDLLKKSLSSGYGSIAWYYLFEKQFQKTVDAAKKGLALDADQKWIYSNLALGYLLQSKWNEAKEIYAKYKSEFEPVLNAYFKDIFLDDLKTLREAGIISPLMRDAEEFLLR